jgi:hypothetical protein
MATEKKGQTKTDKDQPLELSEEELKRFFSEELATIPSPEEVDLEEDDTETGPSPKKTEKDETPPESEVETKAKPTPEDSVAELMKKVPEKFRSEDFATALDKMVQGWDEMQSRITKREKEIERMQRAMRAQQQAQTGPRQPSQVQPPQLVPQYGAPDPTLYAAEMATRPDPIEEPEAYQQWMDQRYLQMGQHMLGEFGKNMTQHLTRQTQSQFAEAQKQQMLANEFNSFRSQTPDFDDYKDDMMRIIEEHPYLNEQPGAIESVYEMAKERKNRQVESLKSKVKPEGYDDLKKAIVVIGREISKINKRAQDDKARVAKEIASGMGGSTGPVSPQQRLNPLKEKDLSDDEQVWQSILRSSIGGSINEGDANAMDLLNLERFAKPIKGEL